MRDPANGKEIDKDSDEYLAYVVAIGSEQEAGCGVELIMVG